MNEYELAKKRKEGNKDSQKKIVAISTPYIGIIKSMEPLIITIESGKFIYSGNQIKQTRTFKNLNPNVAKVGASVLVSPLNSLNTIVVIDVMEV